MCEGVEYDDHLAGKAGIFHQDDASWSYKSEELYDNYDSQLYDAYSDSEQPVKKEIPWPVISTHQSPLMDMTQSRRSFYDSESGVPNTPRAYYEGLETDKLLQSLTPATESVMGDYFDQHLPGNEEKWESYTGQKSSMFNPMEPVSTLPTKEAAKRDILPNPFLYNANSRSVDQPTMSTPTRPIDDKSRDNYPVESSPEDHELEHQLSYSPDATDSEVHNLPKIFRRIKYAGERKPAVADDDRGKPVVISNRNSTSKESLILHKDSRKHNISILDFVFTTIKPSRVRESTRIDMINSEASSLEHRITSRPSQTTGEHLPSEARSLSLSSSDSSKSFKPSFNVSRKQTTLLPSFTNSESDKTSMQFYSSAFRIPDSSQLINFTARSKQSEGESVTLVTTNTTPILTHFLATKNLNHTIKEDLDSVKSSVGVTSFSLGVSDVMVASLPYGFQVSEPFRYPGGFRASETSSRPQGDPPVGFLASEPFYYKGDDQATTTPAGSEPDGFLVSEPFKYTFDNEPTLASSISLHPTVRDFPNDFTLETFHLTQNSQPTLEVGLGPTLASVFTRPSARPNEDVLGNFLQSEPFHFVLREKSADIARTSQSRTPVLSSASLTLQPSHSKSDSLTTTAFMSTSHSEHLVSASSVLGSSADARILPTARYSHVQPTSAWMSTTAIAGIGANSSDGGGYTESQNEGAERDTVWPVVAALVVGIPSVIVFGIAITVFHRRRWVGWIQSVGHYARSIVLHVR